MALSRAERMLRVGQGSPTELHSRKPKHGWPRRGSRLSSPEADGLSPPTPGPVYGEASPINSYFPPTLSSPASPICVDETTFSGPAGSSTIAPVTNAGPMMSDPAWPQHQYPTASPSHAQTEFASPFSMQQLLPLYNPVVQSHGSDGNMVGINHAVGMDQSTGMGNYTSMIMPVGLSPDRLNNAHPHTRIGDGASGDSPSRSSRHSRGSAEDEEPFTFNKEYIAATTALFNEEVLPAYPDFPEIGRSVQASPPPASTMVGVSSMSMATATAAGARQVQVMPQMAISRQGFYFASDHDLSPPPSPSYQTGELYGARMRQDLGHHRHQAYATEHLSYGASFAPGGSSSLTGWAG